MKRRELDHAARAAGALQELAVLGTPPLSPLISAAIAANQSHEGRELKSRERERIEVMRDTQKQTIFPKDDVPAGHVAIPDEIVLELVELPRIVRPKRFQKINRDVKCPREGCGKLIGNHSLKRFKEHFAISTFGEPLERRAQEIAAELESEEAASAARASFEALQFPETIEASVVAQVRGTAKLFGCRLRYISEAGAPRSFELLGEVSGQTVTSARYEQHGKPAGDWYLTRKDDAPVKNKALTTFRAARSRELASV